MYGIYAPVLLLQAFCIYHAYRNTAEQRWYWLIVLFPLIGSIIYLVSNFNTTVSIENLKENVRQTVVTNYKVERLEKAMRFSDNIKNRINLADAYVEIGRYQDAIGLYTACLQGFMSDDPFIRMKLLHAHFRNGDHNQVIECGSGLEGEKSFRNSDERVAYAWSLFEVGRTQLAENVFEDLDRSYTNYNQRLEYCKFLIKSEKWESAKEKLGNLLEEFEQMQGTERRLKKDILREVRDLQANHFQSA